MSEARKRYTSAQRRQALDAARDENGVPRCAICGEPIDEAHVWHMAHGIGDGDSRSLWAGGSNDAEHVGPGHSICNQRQESQERPRREKADRAGGRRGSQYGKRQRRQEREAAGLARPMWGKQRIPKTARLWPKGRKIPSRPFPQRREV